MMAAWVDAKGLGVLQTCSFVAQPLVLRLSGVTLSDAASQKPAPAPRAARESSPMHQVRVFTT